MKASSVFLSFSVTRESALLSSFEGVLARLTASRPLPFFRGQFLSDLKLAFVEGGANAIRHAHELANRGRIACRLGVSSRSVEIRIDDHGGGFSMSRFRSPAFSRVKESGRGLFLMRQLMDVVDYKKGKSKNVLILRRTIPGLGAEETSLDLLYEISDALARGASPEGLYQLILDRAVTAFGVEKASLLMFDSGSKKLRVVASRGLSPSLSRRIALKPGEGIAGYVYQHAKPCLIEDMSRNRSGWKKKGRYKSRSFISAPMICSPLRVGPDPVGVINVTDRKNGRPFTRSDLRLLSTMANQASACLHLSSLIGRAREGEALRREMEIAGEIQKSYLPMRPPDVSGFDLAGSCQTAQAVGGDYFDCIRQGRHFYVVIADVSGHNIAAALTMVSFRSHLKALLSSEDEPGKIMTRLNGGLFDDLAPQDQFISACLVRLSPDAASGEVVVAGHRVPLLLRHGEIAPLVDQEGSGGVLGLDRGEVYSSSGFSLRKGEALVFYTDGIIDMTNNEGQRLGFEGFVKMLNRQSRSTATEIVSGIMEELNRFRGQSVPTDDRTLMVVRSTGGAS